MATYTVYMYMYTVHAICHIQQTGLPKSKNSHHWKMSAYVPWLCELFKQEALALQYHVKHLVLPVSKILISVQQLS